MNFLFSFLIHLIIHKQLWLKSNSIYNQIKTSFIKSKLITHLTDVDFDTLSRLKTSNERVPLTGISNIDESIYEVNLIKNLFFLFLS